MKGYFKGRAQRWKFDVSPLKGTPFVRIEFQITEGPNAGSRARWDGFLTELTEERTMESLRICGWDGDDVTNPQSLDANEVELKISEETYTNNNGEQKTVNKVDFINSLASFSTNPQLTEEKRREFAARFADAAKRSRAGRPSNGAPPSSPGSQPQAQSLDDDPIPF